MKKSISLKKTLSLLLTLALILTLMPAVTPPARADPNFHGSGISSDPFIIADNSDLAYLAVFVNSAADNATYNANTVYYKLADSFDNSADAYGADAGEVPIGTATATTIFFANFDGNGKNVALNINITTDSSYVGLFGYLDAGASVHDLSVSGSVTGSGEFATVGGLAGQAGYNGGVLLTNCSSSASVTGGISARVGGLAGVNNVGRITNCYATGSVEGGNFAAVGGLVGTNADDAIANSYATGSVEGGSDAYVGGLVGYNNSTVVITNGYWNSSAAQTVDSAARADDQKLGVGNRAGTATTKTAAEMQSRNFVDTLNANRAGNEADWLRWQLPETGINGGFPVFGYFSFGTGAQNDPFIIADNSDLAYLAVFVNSAADNATYNANTVYYKLADSFDNSTDAYGADAGEVPIGTATATTIFFANFDGNGKNVALNINITTDSSYVGLFGYLDAGASVHDLSVSGSVTGSGEFATVGGLAGQAGYNGGVLLTNCSSSASVTGGISARVGGLAGYSESRITNCYATGSVEAGNSSAVGGLVGYNESTITNSYATGSVEGGNFAAVGGLVGTNADDAIANSYATGSVEGGSDAYVGGLVGYNNSTVVITNGYWNSSAAQTVDSAARADGQKLGVGNRSGGTPKTAAEMQSWNFVDTLNANRAGNEADWLWWQLPEAGINGGFPVFGYFSFGTGAQNDPFIIADNADLARLASLVNNATDNATYNANTVHYKLADSFDNSADAYGDGAGELPIGTATAPTALFFANFDGNGKDVALNINVSTRSAYVGLFGYLGAGASLHDLSVSGSVMGSGAFTLVGGLAGVVGYNGIAYMTNCSSSASVTGGDGAWVGSLAGVNNVGRITNCYATGSVEGGSDAYVGGLVGYNGLTITNCYATGSVEGGSRAAVGGLAGNNSNNITNCYATGSVEGGSDAYVGGLVGFDGNTITNGYWNSSAAQIVDGTARADGQKLGVGIGPGVTTKTAAEMQSWNFVDTLNANRAGNEADWLRWQLPETGINGGFPNFGTGTQPIVISDPVIRIEGVDLTYAKGSDGTVTVIPTEKQMKDITENASGDTVALDFSPVPGITGLVFGIDPGWFDNTGKSLTFCFNGYSFTVLDGMFHLLGELTDGKVRFSVDMSVSISVSQGGKEIDWYNYAHPMTISMPSAAGGVMIDKATGRIIPRSWYRDGAIFAKVYNAGTYNVNSVTQPSFTDTAGLWMDKATSYMAAREILKGVGDNLFAPDRNVTRGEFITMLMRMMNIEMQGAWMVQQFDDAKEGAFYYDALLSAKALGLVNGIGGNRFAPDGEISRQDMFVMLYRAMEKLGMITSVQYFADPLMSFTDKGQIADYAYEPLAQLIGQQLVSGKGGGIIDPTGTATRAEAAQVQYNVLIRDAG